MHSTYTLTNFPELNVRVVLAARMSHRNEMKKKKWRGKLERNELGKHAVLHRYGLGKHAVPHRYELGKHAVPRRYELGKHAV